MPRQITWPIPLVGGVDLLHDAAAIPNGKVAGAADCFPTVSGELSKRQAAAVWRPAKPGIIDPNNYLTSTALNIISVKGLSGRYPFLAILATGNLTTGGTFKVWPDNGVVTGDVGVCADDRPRFVDVGDEVIILRGNDTYAGIGFLSYFNNEWRLLPSTFTYADGTLNYTQNLIPIKPKVAAVYLGSVVYGRLGPGYEKSLLFADNEPASTYNALGGLQPLFTIVGNEALTNNLFVDLVGAEGTKITGLATIELNAVGSPIQQALLVLTEFDAYIATGRPEQSWSTAERKLGTLEIVKVNYRVGCAAQETICRTPAGLIWASDSEVWMLRGATQPVAIGIYLRPFMLNLPPDIRHAWHAIYEPQGVYRLIFAVEVSTDGVTDIEPATSAPIQRFRYVEWWLDLRNGIPNGAADAQWYGPMEYAFVQQGLTPNPLVQSPRWQINKPNMQADTLISVLSEDVGDGSGGTAYELRSVVVDVSAIRDRDDSAFDVSTSYYSALTWEANASYTVGQVVRPTIFGLFYYVCTVAGTSGASEPAWPDVTSGSITDNTITWVESSNYGSHIGLLPAGNAIQLELSSKDYDADMPNNEKTFIEMAVEAYSERGGQLEMDVITDAGIANVEATAQLSQVPLILGGGFGIFGAPTQSRAIQPADTVRINGRRMQFVVRDSDSYVIDASNDTIYAAFWNNPSIVDFIEINIPQGVYADNAALVSAFQTALNALTSASPTTAGNTLGTYFPNGWVWSLVLGSGRRLQLLTLSDFNYPVYFSGIASPEPAVSAACMQLFGLEEFSPSNLNTRWYDDTSPYVIIYSQTPMAPNGVTGWRLHNLEAKVNVWGRTPTQKAVKK